MKNKLLDSISTELQLIEQTVKDMLSNANSINPKEGKTKAKTYLRYLNQIQNFKVEADKFVLENYDQNISSDNIFNDYNSKLKQIIKKIIETLVNDTKDDNFEGVKDTNLYDKSIYDSTQYPIKLGNMTTLNNRDLLEKLIVPAIIYDYVELANQTIDTGVDTKLNIVADKDIVSNNTSNDPNSKVKEGERKNTNEITFNDKTLQLSINKQYHVVFDLMMRALDAIYASIMVFYEKF